MASNHITHIQNDPAQIALLRARQHLRYKLNHLALLQVVVTVLVPIAGGFIPAGKIRTRSILAAVALFVALLDLGLLEREQRSLMSRMANLAEQFDVNVFQLSWDECAAGDPLPPEEIVAASTAFHGAGPSLSNWYPSIVSQLPLPVARIACQRASLQYDSRLRRSYANLLRILQLAAALLIVCLGVFFHQSATDLVLLGALFVPFFVWSIREYFRQVDSFEVSEHLLGIARRLWSAVLDRAIDEEETTLRSRELQSAIYRRRAMSPPIPGFLYKFKHRSMEQSMTGAAERLVEQYRLSQAPDTKPC